MRNRSAIAADLAKIMGHADDIRKIVSSRLMPPEAAGHFRRAEKEALLGLQALLDAAVRRLDEKERQPHAGKTKGKTVDIAIDE